MDQSLVQIRWKGYGEDEDTWEPEDGLRYNIIITIPTLVLPISLYFLFNCCISSSTSGALDKLKEFVTNGFNSKILPLPVS